MPMEKSVDIMHESFVPWCLPTVIPDISLLDWHYVAEGNNNIVFGNDSAAIVLRILKDADNAIKKDCTPYENDVEEQWAYLCNVIRPLLSRSGYLLDGKLVPISDRLIIDVSEKMRHCRPKFRSSRGISNTYGKAFIYPHLGTLRPSICTAQTLCVEIKPKWGFLTKVKSMKGENSIKDRVCRFCMYQKLKVSRGEVSQLSGYCPLDLFAGCSCRMKHALKSLLGAPQNNLRVFMDGNLVFGGYCKEVRDIGSLEHQLKSYFGVNSRNVSTLDHLVNILTMVFTRDSYGDSDSATQENFNSSCSSLYSVCPKSAQHFKIHAENKEVCKPFGDRGVFSTLKPLQRLGGIDIEDVYPIYASLADKIETQVQIRNYRSTAWQGVVNELTSDLIDNSDVDKESMLSCTSSSLCKFLIASTFRDCSLMISLHESSSLSREPRMVYDSCSGKRFVYKIHITDMDPKDPKRIPRYLKMDREIIEHYTRS